MKNLGDTLCLTTQKKFSLTTLLSPKLKSKKIFHLPSDKNNLVWKAADLFFSTTHLPPSGHLILYKNAPFGAGLGSGSSNAATTLKLLNQWHYNPLTDVQLQRLCGKLGSDVPFFLHPSPAWVSGKGEIIEPFPISFQGWWLLINPGFMISTPWAYRQLTKKSRDVTKPEYKNSFEEVIYLKYPMLKQAKQTLLKNGAQLASLSGSGPTLFGLFQRKRLAHNTASLFQKKGWLTWVSQGA